MLLVKGMMRKKCCNMIQERYAGYHVLHVAQDECSWCKNECLSVFVDFMTVQYNYKFPLSSYWETSKENAWLSFPCNIPSINSVLRPVFARCVPTTF